MDLIFGIGYLLWMLIKGIFKLISLPFRLIRNIILRKKWANERNIEKLEKEKRLEQKRQMVEGLFQRITSQVLLLTPPSNMPTKILVHHDEIQFYYEDGSKKVLSYADYFSENLTYYSTYWCTDGSKSEEDINQPMFLAQKINSLGRNLYSIDSKTKEAVSTHSDVTMHHYIQEYVEMLRK